MPLLNYTTEISESKTLGEITGLLISAKAQAILTEFDGVGNATAVSFKIVGKFGPMSYRLPCEYKAAQQVLNTQSRTGKVPSRYFNDAVQARRVAWRITRQWLEAQLALVELQMVPIEQIFLSYMQTDDGRTVYERLEERKFSGLMLTDSTP
jgi:hypothetical protein